MVKDRRVGQVYWRVAWRLGEALWLLERPSGVGINTRHLGTAVT